MLDIARAIGDRDIMVLSDEIYSRLLFEGEPYSIASVDGFKDRTIILDRLFEDVFDDRLAAGIRRDAPRPGAQFARLATNSTSCTATFTQIAGVEAVQRRPERAGEDAPGIPAAPRRFR